MASRIFSNRPSLKANSSAPRCPQATTNRHTADWISSYYQHLDHASVLTLADLKCYGLNADHMNNHPEVREFCMEALHAAQVAFILTHAVKVVRHHVD